MTTPPLKRGDLVRWRAHDGTERVGYFRRTGVGGRLQLGVTKATSSAAWWIDREQVIEARREPGEESGE